MQLQKLFAAGIEGVNGYLVTVEVNRQAVGSGAGRTTVVGLPDNAVRESVERIKPALFSNYLHNKQNDNITVNLAPAHKRKEGPSFDLAIALGIAATMDGPPDDREKDNKFDQLPTDTLFLAELALDGTLRPVHGALAAAQAAVDAGLTRMVVAPENGAEAAIIDDLEVYTFTTLKEVADAIRTGWGQALSSPEPATHTEDHPDMSDVRGQEHAKRALKIAAAGGHNTLFIGPPGSGKTMLARRLPGILPPMTTAEALEVTRIHSVSGLLSNHDGLIQQRPFRAPHHNTSDAGLIGGGSMPKPGEVTLASNGVLFLDELPEFNRRTLETLRQPLEDGHLIVSRAAGRLTFPSRCMLIAAMNPCPCGYLGHPSRRCTDNNNAIHNYRNRISGPLLDRIDIHLEVPAQSPQQIDDGQAGDSSEDIRATVNQARARMINRQGCSNAELSGKLLQQHVQLPEDAKQLLHQAVDELGLSARAYDRIRKVARSIADLDNRDNISIEDISEAIGYRLLDRQT